MIDGHEGPDQATPGPAPRPSPSDEHDLGGGGTGGTADGGSGASELAAVLTRSRDLGFLGPGPIDDHLTHADGFRAGLAAATPPAVGGQVRVLDLGSGGGLPGLALALDPSFAGWSWVLLDAAERRTAFLSEAVEELGLDEVTVVRGRAEELGRREDLRGQFSAVVSRSFGAPAVTAECAAPFLASGGVLCVSEPPGTSGDERWPPEGLALLGLAWDRQVTGPGTTASLLRQVAPCGERYPRRTGVPSRRPLF